MEFDVVVVKNNPGMCRCCLSEGCYKDLSTEYSWMGETEIYADMLWECFDISISQQMEGPNGPNRLICEVCITRLRDACNFKKQVTESEKKFVDMVARGDFPQKSLIQEEAVKQEPSHSQDTLEVEYLEEMDFDDGHDAEESFQTEEPEQSIDAESITVDALPIKRGRGRPKKSSTVVKTEKKKIKISKDEEKPRSSRVVAKDDTQMHVASTIRRRNNLLTIFNHTSIIPFKWRGSYRCFYCSKNISEYSELKDHTIKHGKCSLIDHSIKILTGSHSEEVKIDISEIRCRDCNTIFDNYDKIVAHLVSQHDLPYDATIDSIVEPYLLKTLSCHLCDEKFTYFRYLVSHMNNKHPKNCHICDTCNQNFNKKRDLLSHVMNYHREGGYKCELCPRKFNTQHILRSHHSQTHLTWCDICKMTLPSAALKRKHMRLDHAKDEDKRCDKCDKTFHTTVGLTMHLRKCNIDSKPDFRPKSNNLDKNYEVGITKRKRVQQIRDNIITVINMSTATPFCFYKNRFNCFFCSEDFTDCDSLKEHTIASHPSCDSKSDCIRKCREATFTVKVDVSKLDCKICFKPMTDINALVTHLISQHNANYDKTYHNSIQPYKLIKDQMECPHCPDQIFRFFGTLLKHVNSKHTDNNIICVYCGKSFRKEQNLRVHIWRHHKEGKFTCNICSTECGIPSRLYMHMAKAHGVKAAKCPKCDETFETQYLRQKHLIDVHETGHKCTYCDKLFVRSSFMKDHIRRTHLKEKNVECNVCNMKFFNNILLRRHMVKHSGEKNFHCDVCGDRFFWRKGLVRHVSRHQKITAEISA